MPKTKPLCDVDVADSRRTALHTVGPIVNVPPIEQTTWRPPLLLAGRHAQTMASSLPLRYGSWRRRTAKLRAQASRQLLELHDGVRLQGQYTPGADSDKGLVVLLHGWEGAADSNYMLSLALALNNAGYATFRLNFRDHGGTHVLNVDLFHSCRISEVVDAVAVVQERYSPSRFALVGYSLGGNFALRVGARAAEAGVELEKIIAVCPVLHPPHTMDALETGLWAYRRYYLRKWRRSLLAKQASFPHRYRLGDLSSFKPLTATTDFFVREYTEFPDIETYLHGYSILGSALEKLCVPSRVIAASDDPIIPSADLARLSPNPNLELSVLPWGGHCGFVTSYRLTSCMDHIVVDELERTTRPRKTRASP
jgi:predicted alpha/beta-fold hydrolase